MGHVAEASIGLTTLRVWTKGPRRTSEFTPVASPSSPRRGLSALLVPYRGAIATLVALTIAGNALNLLIPKLVADAIDSYGRRTLVPGTVAPGLFLAAAGILIFGYLQSIVQTYAAERVARDLRTRLVARDRRAGPRLHPAGRRRRRC